METIGRYTLLERLGEGGMAEVFRGRLEGPMGFQKDVAIKRIRDSVVKKDEEAARSLINEARIGGRLKHPNVVEVYELGEEDGLYYIVMEMVDGISLRDLLGSKRQLGPKVPPNVILDIAIQAARGLAYAHSYCDEDGDSLAVVHRDVKPSNIMITRAGTVKIMDFGIAKSEGNLFNTTATGIAKGTPLYMSPEQLRGARPLKPASDLFSLGAILFEMVTGELLFAGSTIPEIINRVLYQPLDADIELAEKALPGMGEVLRRLLERDAVHRAQDASAIAVELEHLLEWQEKSRSTSRFVKSWLYTQQHPEAQSSLEMRQLPEPVAIGTTLPRSAIDEQPGEDTFDSLYATTVARRRLGYLLVALLFLFTAGAAATYIYRGTLVADGAQEDGMAALARGDLEAAERALEASISANPGQGEARYALVALRARSPLSELEAEELRELLSRVPAHGLLADASRLRAQARILASAADFDEASLIAEAAMGRARQAVKAGEGAVPPALLWEAAEYTLLRDVADSEDKRQSRRDRARAYFTEFRSLVPPGTASDAAASYIDLLERKGEVLLRAELLWRLGQREAAWALLPDFFRGRSRTGDLRQREHLVWIFRALGEGRYEAVDTLLSSLGLLTGEPERRRQAQVARAAELAHRGRLRDAKKKLEAALKSTKNPDASATARLQVALALLRGGDGSDWVAGLLEEIALQVGDDDPDLRALLTLRAGDQETADLASTPDLSFDPRTGRFFPGALRRGAPNGGLLAAPRSFATVNRSPTGLAWPFGPAFHPVSGEALPSLYHPAR